MNNEKAHGYREKNSLLVQEFDRYIFEHPEFADKLPDNALLIMQIVGDEEFNAWARQMGAKCAEEDNSVVYVMITHLKPLRSRIESMEIEMVA